ncbi:RHOM protein, partial [Acromyrmex insinuator]
MLFTEIIFLKLVKLSFSVRKIRTIDAVLSAPVGIFNRETPCEPRKSRQRSSAFPLVAAHECASKESASTCRSALALRRVTDTGGFSENKALPAVRVHLLARICVDVATSLCTRLKSKLKQNDRRFMKSFTDLIKIKLAFFTYYTVAMGEVNPSGPVPIDSVFIYRPDKRLELWRFAFYMFLHAGWLHLLFNLGVQVVVGLPLEMVHGSLRIAAVYMAGVLAGSLGTSVFDTDVYLVGASGGVYALLAAHLANVLLNYNNMEFGIVRLIGIFVIASADVGFAIYDRYAAEQMGPPVSYVAHLTGALAGLTIGLLVLKNFEQRLHEQLLWWVALGVYAACTIFAIMYNLMHPDYP